MTRGGVIDWQALRIKQAKKAIRKAKRKANRVARKEAQQHQPAKPKTHHHPTERELLRKLDDWE